MQFLLWSMDFPLTSKAFLRAGQWWGVTMCVQIGCLGVDSIHCPVSQRRWPHTAVFASSYKHMFCFLVATFAPSLLFLKKCCRMWYRSQRVPASVLLYADLNFKPSLYLHFETHSSKSSSQIWICVAHTTELFWWLQDTCEFHRSRAFK